MLSGRRTRNRMITVARTLAFTSVAAAIFTLLMFPGRWWLLSVWTGVSSGLLIGAPVVLWVFLGLETGIGRRLKRLPLLAYLAVNATITSVLLLIGHLSAFYLIWPDERRLFLDDTLLPSLLFSIALVIVVSIVIELRRLIGPGVFGPVLLGRYRYPRSERRVFLLLDIVGSTGLAERLGPERFLAFLDRWIHQLTEPLLASDGLIYRYIGDEMILTWVWTPDAASQALAFAADAAAAVARDAEIWNRDFGTVPEMRAALHAGPVMAGEIGDLKREITFLGDTLNTAARIAGEARKHGGLVLASTEALEGTRLPGGWTRRDLGPVTLRGKAEPLALAVIGAPIDERTACP